MGRPGNDVDRIGMIEEDGGQRLDHRLQSLVGGDEAEGQQHLAAGEAEARLGALGGRIRPVRDAVGHHHDLALRHAVDALQDLAPLFRHDDQPGGGADQPLHDPPLVRIGPLQNGMERHHDRNGKALDQRQQVGACGPAENAEFVLDPDQLGAAGFDPLGSGQIVGERVLTERTGHRGRVIIGLAGIVHRIMIDPHFGEACAERVENVRGVGRKAAAARQRIPDQGNVRQGRSPD